MKKTVVIPLKKIVQKMILTICIFTVLISLFSFNIPHLICRMLTQDMLHHDNSFLAQISKIFSFKSSHTVYAAMPLEHTKKNTETTKQKSVITKQTPAPSPTQTPPPESDLSDSSRINHGVQLKNHTGKSVDITELLKLPLSYRSGEDGYKVLLVHTHTTECYFPNDRSENPQENMIRVGQEFQKVLEENGIPTLHITTVHDVPYTTSYKKSLQSVEQALKEHPSIEVVIDLHRDAIYGANNEKIRPIATIDGIQTAQVMLVCGTDEGGLPHPDWKDCLSFAVKIQNRMEANYPNLARPVDLRKERFNTHTTKNSVIFEIGSHGNTLEEAILGAKLAAQSVADVLNGN